MTANPAKGGCETESDDDEDFKLSQPRAGPSGRAGEVVTDEESTDEDDGASGSGSVPMKQLKQPPLPLMKSTTVEFGDTLNANNPGRSDSEISEVPVAEPVTPDIASPPERATLPSEASSGHGAWARRQTVQQNLINQASSHGHAVVPQRTSYRRGTVALQVIQQRVQQGVHTTDDERALMAMRQAQAQHINSRTVSAIGGIFGGSGGRDPYAASSMPRDIAQAFLRKVFVLFFLQQLCAITLTLLMCLDEPPLTSPVHHIFEDIFHPISADSMAKVAELQKMTIPSMLTKYKASVPKGSLCKIDADDGLISNTTAVLAACDALRANLLVAVTDRNGALGPLVGAAAGLIFTLLVLFFTKYLWPFNYFSLLLFTFGQSFFYGGISLYFDTRMGWVILIFVAAFTLIKYTLLTCGGSWFGHGSPHRFKKVTLIGWLPCLAVLVAMQLKFQLMTTPVFAGVAVFCSILVVWFGFETRNLCDKLSPDEYMQAIVLYYSDMCILMLALFFYFAALMLAEDGGVAEMGCCEADSSCFMIGVGCDGYCCTSCYGYGSAPIAPTRHDGNNQNEGVLPPNGISADVDAAVAPGRFEA